MNEDNNQPKEIEEPLENQESDDDSELNTLTYEELQQKNEELKEEALRARAELENFKKRVSAEVTNTLKYANTELLNALIPIITSIEKAIDNTEDQKSIDKEGVLLILNSFEKTLENFNIAPINPIGEEFNPELHEAVSMVNESGESDNIVVKTLERGWLLNERVIKPALVVVNKNN
ncbi:MAG: nucleotide exchange factor GrpE [SAR86 cluster bacterium]|uniref:Protein GrpE n=1 Tax=SAR86 cluster bacterium TaxID=2030880 RepID=A0A937LMV3_9GAMM|nr:nucleotide exchange factor GrpE [SAR86 cluster bacterium]